MTHPIFQNGGLTTEELEFFNEIVEETIYFAGKECYYIPRNIDAIDQILNEVMNSKYEHAYKIDVFREEIGGFFPNDFFISKFGNEFGGGNTIFSISKSKFIKITDRKFPNQGDLLVFPAVKQIYEIKDIDTSDPWISNGKIFYWKASCLPFERNKTHNFDGDIFDFLDQDTSQILGDFVRDTNIYDVEIYTIDTTCSSIDSSYITLDDDRISDLLWGLTLDSDDIDLSDDEVNMTTDNGINNGIGSMQKMTHSYVDSQKYTDQKNEYINEEVKKYNVTNTYGFE